MAGESEESLDPQAAIKGRLKEQTALGRLLSQRVSKAESWLSKRIEPGSGEGIQDVIETLKGVGRHQADTHWVTAMMQAGVPFDAILRVWDIKDQRSRALRSSKNEENPEEK